MAHPQLATFDTDRGSLTQLVVALRRLKLWRKKGKVRTFASSAHRDELL